MPNKDNLQQDLKKCNAIKALLPHVRKDIRELQQVDKHFEADFNLKLADQFLTSLDEIKLSGHEEIDTYRDKLTSGLTSLGFFLDNIKSVEKLNEQQRDKMMSITANIVMHQDSIIRIATS